MIAELLDIAVTELSQRDELVIEALKLLFKDSHRDPYDPIDGEQASLAIASAGMIIAEQYLLRQTDGGRERSEREIRRIASAAHKLYLAIEEAHPSTLHRVNIGLQSGKKFDSSKVQKIKTWAQKLSITISRKIPKGEKRGRIWSLHKYLSACFCFRIFEEFRPGQASSYDDGDFLHFCQLMYEAHTDDPNTDMTRAVKQCIRSERATQSENGTQ